MPFLASISLITHGLTFWVCLGLGLYSPEVGNPEDRTSFGFAIFDLRLGPPVHRAGWRRFQASRVVWAHGQTLYALQLCILTRTAVSSRVSLIIILLDARFVNYIFPALTGPEWTEPNL